jgi:ankyrin repeat protein
MNNYDVSQFVRADGSDAIPRMARMLLVDKTITDIDVKDRDGYTALYYQAYNGTTGNMAWLLMQDPPPEIDIRGPSLGTPLVDAVYSDIDPEGKVRLLIEYGADRDLKDKYGNTALSYARLWKKPAVIDILENYRPDVSR